MPWNPRLQVVGGNMKYDSNLISYVLLLRFGRCSDLETATPVLNYTSIARLIRVPVTTVIELVKAGVASSRYASPVVAPSRFKFKQHHIGYLVSSTTLQESTPKPQNPLCFNSLW